MKVIYQLCVITLGCLLLASCKGTLWGGKEKVVVTGNPIVIRASGFGTYEDVKDRSDERKRLLAMRASKLDAYRSLAERVYGTSIYGASSVKELVLQSDQFRTVIDTLIRGAKVVSVNELESGSFETVVEVTLSPAFQTCLTDVNTFRFREECRVPIPRDDFRDFTSASKGDAGLYFLE